jgi:hypothetical protein
MAAQSAHVATLIDILDDVIKNDFLNGGSSMDLGQLIAAGLSERDWTQQDLADALAPEGVVVGRTTVSAWLRNATFPRPSALKALALLLGWSPDQVGAIVLNFDEAA